MWLAYLHKEISLKSYLWSRAARILPVYLLALTFMLLFYTSINKKIDETMYSPIDPAVGLHGRSDPTDLKISTKIRGVWGASTSQVGDGNREAGSVDTRGPDSTTS